MSYFDCVDKILHKSCNRQNVSNETATLFFLFKTSFYLLIFPIWIWFFLQWKEECPLFWKLFECTKMQTRTRFFGPFLSKPLCDWVNALAIFKLPLFPICRDGLLSFLWCRNPWRQQVSLKIVMHSIDSNLTLSSQLEIRYYLLCREKIFESKSTKKYYYVAILLDV